MQLARGNRTSALFFYLGYARGTQTEIQIRGGERKLVAGSFKQIVRENRNSGLALDHSLGRRELSQELKLADRNLHGGSSRRGCNGFYRHNLSPPPSGATFDTSLISKQKPIKPALTAGNKEKLGLANCDSSAQLLGQLVKQPVQVLVGLADGVDFFDRVQYGCMVLTAELAANLGQGRFGQVLGQIHRDLPWINDGARIVLRLDLHQPQSELLCDRLLNRFNGDFPRL